MRTWRTVTVSVIVMGASLLAPAASGQGVMASATPQVSAALAPPPASSADVVVSNTNPRTIIYRADVANNRSAHMPNVNSFDTGTFPSTIRPRLRMLPNGLLTLLGGREDTYVAVSADGTGKSFTNPILVYRNGALDQDGNRVPYPATINEGSSGNSGFDWVASNRIAVVADTCHSLYLSGQFTDKCHWRDQVYTMSDTDVQGVIRKSIDILTPGAGKLNLNDMIRSNAGSLTVTGQYTTSARPRLGANGAFDGSTETWSAAATSGADGHYLVKLDKAYRLNRLGLAQWIGHEQTASVEVATSPDGPWTTWLPATTATSLALDYYNLPTVTAQYVRVTPIGRTDCPTGMTAPCSMLNEIELYAADTQTFENDPLYTFPRDYQSSPTGVRTTDVNTAGGGRVLELSDVTTAVNDVHVTKTVAPSANKLLNLKFKPHWNGFDQEVANDKFIITISGTSGKSTVPVYTAGVGDDGAVYTLAKGAWKQIGPAGTVPGTLDNNDAWSNLSIRASVSSATFAVNGKDVGALTKQASVKELTSHTLACDTGPAVDDQIFYLNDIEFTTGS